MNTTTHTLMYQFPDLASLKRAYMDFVRDGGVFVPTDEIFHLGDTVTAILLLPQSEQPFTFTAEVIWITHKSAGNEQGGVGIQCSDNAGESFQTAAQELLGGMPEDIVDSDTM